MHAFNDLVFCKFLDFERVGDVVKDAFVWPNGVTLKNHADVALFRWHENAVGEVSKCGFAELDFTVGRPLESGNHPQCGGFAAAGWPQQADEFAVPDLQ